LIFNVGHVGNKSFSYQATAAVPPIVSMLGLFVLLRTLHRYVSQQSEPQEAPKAPEPQPRAPAGPVTLNQITLMPFRNAGPFPQIQVPGHSGKAIESGTADTADADTGKAQTATATAEAPATGAATAGAPTTGQAEPAPAPPAAPAQPSTAAPSAHAQSPAPAPAPAPEPAPEPELAVVSAAARGGLNGRSGYGAAAEPAAPAPEPEPAPDPEGLRNFVIDALERRHGDVLATLADVKAAGYTCDEAEIQRISDNHWFPYAVYRLLDKHGGDGRLVAEELRSQGI